MIGFNIAVTKAFRSSFVCLRLSLSHLHNFRLFREIYISVIYFLKEECDGNSFSMSIDNSSLYYADRIYSTPLQSSRLGGLDSLALV